MSLRLTGPCPIARALSVVAITGLAALPLVREADGATLRGAELVVAGFASSSLGVVPHPTVAMLLIGVVTAAVTLASQCPRRAWRASLVGSLGLVGVIACGFDVDAAQSVPAVGLYVAAGALAIATLCAAVRSLFVPSELAPDPRDEVGDPRIDGSPGPDIDPDEIREIAEMNERASA